MTTDPLFQAVQTLLERPMNPHEERAIFDRVDHQLREHIDGDSRSSRAPRRRHRIALASAALAIGMCAIAVAAPGVVKRVLGDRDEPANQMEVFQPDLDDSAQLSAFTDPADPSQMNAAMTARMLRSMQQYLDADDELLSETFLRLLLQFNRDGLQTAIYAIPSKNGKVCYTTTDGISVIGTCVDAFGETRSITSGHGSSIAPPGAGVPAGTRSNQVAGLMDDRVDGVAIALDDGRVEDAVLGRNAYAWKSSDPTHAPVGVLVRLKSGDVEIYDVDGTRLDSRGLDDAVRAALTTWNRARSDRRR